MAWSVRGKQISVAAAGTPVIGNATTQLVKGLVITADVGNTGVLFVQDSSVAAVTNHLKLTAGQQVSFVSDQTGEIDLSKIYFDKSAGTVLVNLGWLLPV